MTATFRESPELCWSRWIQWKGFLRFPATQKQSKELLALRALYWFRQAPLLKRQSPSTQRLLPYILMLISIKNIVLIKTVPPVKKRLWKTVSGFPTSTKYTELVFVLESTSWLNLWNLCRAESSGLQEKVAVF